MGSYITTNQNNTGWNLTLKALGRYPLIADRIFETLADAQAYVNDTNPGASATEGLIISVIKDTDKNNGVYYISSIPSEAGETGELIKVGGTETEEAKNYTKAVELSKTLAVGQLIKVTEQETVTTGEGESAVTNTYQAGFYIVNSAGSISALSTSTGADDEVGALKGRVDTLEGVVGNADSGLVKEVADLKTNSVTKTDLATAISSVYKFKGSKATYADLPTEGNIVGDVWNVEAAYNKHPAGTNWVWVETTTTNDSGETITEGSWDALAGSVDLSGYATKADLKVKDVKADDNVLSLDANGNVYSTLSLGVSEEKNVQLLGKTKTGENKPVVISTLTLSNLINNTSENNLLKVDNTNGGLLVDRTDIEVIAEDKIETALSWTTIS